MRNKPLDFGNTVVQPGESITVALPTPEIYTCAPMHIPIHIVHGKQEGPCLLVCSAIHGDETNGVALIQRLLQLQLLKSLRGTLICIPVLNIYGLITNSRLLPDRRDLESSFPGSVKGTFADRLAYYLSQEIFEKADYFLDIHSGDPHFLKLPHIQANLNDELSSQFARAFDSPIILHTESNKGLLWQVTERKKPALIYETGEALRLDEFGIRLGLKGIIKLMKHLGMLKLKKTLPPPKSLVIRASYWNRTPNSGLCVLHKKIGAHIQKGDLLYQISDPFGTTQVHEEYATMDGIVLGQNNVPLVNEGDSILEIATLEDTKPSSVEEFEHWRDQTLHSDSTT